MRRVVRILVSLIGTIAAYLGYASAVVPLIEPTAPAHVADNSQQAPTGAELPSTSQRFASLFKEGDWERDQPVVLVSGSMALLLKEYEPQADGRLRIKPCTIVMMPEDQQKSDAQRLQEATVLQAAEALLQFDRPLDLGQGQIGNLHLVGGQLLGEIVIRSDQKEAGPDDDLFITTRDLQLQGERILGSNPVQFRLGMHSGRGTELTVQLAAGPPGRGGGRGMNVGGVKSFALARDVEMHLLVKSGGFLPKGKKKDSLSTTPSAAEPPPPPCPMTITCQGPFIFDREALVASFERHVEVVSQPSPGINDRLRNGDRLVLTFAPADVPSAPDAAPPADAAQPAKLSKLKPSRLEATGEPVVIDAPSHQIAAWGQKLVFEAADDTLELSSSREVMLRNATCEVHAKTVHLQRRAEGIGQLLASGQGWLTADIQSGAAGKAQDAPQKMTVRWSDRLQLAEDPENARFQVISVLGNAHVDFAAMGGINAREIYVWLFEPPQPIDAAPVTMPGGGQAMNLLPDRMQARGNVHMKSETLRGDVDELQTWFKFIPEPAVAAPASTPQPAGIPAQSAVYQLPPPGEEELPPPKQPKRRFDVAGRTLQVELEVRGNEASPSHVVLDGRAELTGSPEKEGDKPLRVSGQRIEANQAGETQAVVTVTGRPPAPADLNDRGQLAEVEVNGLKLAGDNVNLDQAANRVWINGPGVLTLDTAGLKSDKDDVNRREAAAAPSAPLYIRWQGSMAFDGLKARFEKSVVAEQGEQWLSAPIAMDAVFTEAINFTDSKTAVRPEIQKVFCYGQVELRRKSYDEQRNPAFEQLQTGKMVLDRLTGELQADGPGQLHRVWLGTASLLPDAGRPGATAARPAARNDAPGAPQLNFLSVKFQRALNGNFPQSGQRASGPAQITFSDRVLTAYGPVTKWDEVIQADHLLTNQFTLFSEALTVRQMETRLAAGTDIELEANGTVRLEGLEFFATGQRVTYTKSKDLLVLEGDGYSPAELYHQRAGITGAPTAAAKEIKFWVSSHTVLSDGTRVINLNQFPGSR